MIGAAAPPRLSFLAAAHAQRFFCGFLRVLCNTFRVEMREEDGRARGTTTTMGDGQEAMGRQAGRRPQGFAPISFHVTSGKVQRVILCISCHF